MSGVKKFLTDLKFDFLELLYPRGLRCSVCGAELDGEAVRGFCGDCYVNLPFNSGRVCEVCGSATDGEENTCVRCQQRGFAFERARSPFVYALGIPELIYGFKFGERRYLAQDFAAFMADTLKRADFTFDIVVPVPLHEKKQRKRGFNQAEDLARELCGIIKCEAPLRTDLLLKIVDTPEQAQLVTAEERAANLEGTFAAGEKKELKGKSILLVDDVLTTGCTAHECAKVLKKNGARAVFVLTLAATKYKVKIES